MEGPEPSLEIWGVAALVAVIIAIAVGVTGKSRRAGPAPALTERERDVELDATAFARAQHPYRARIARVARRVVPLSGRTTALLMSAAFVLSAVALPLGLRLPHWIEAELVIIVWWVGVSALLATLLYKGQRIAEDHRFKLDVPGFGDEKEKRSAKPAKKLGWKDATGCADPAGCADAGGCSEAAAIFVVLAVAALAAWLVVEVVLPLVVFAVYYFLVKAIARVARDKHDCEGKPGRALVWGFAWASVYLVPIGIVVAVIQLVLRLRGS